MTVMSSPAPHILHSAYAEGPHLLADVGGTNARFALELAPGQIDMIEVLPCADYPSLAAALLAYLASPTVAGAGIGNIRHGAIAIANPVTSDFVRMTNHHWAFSIEALRSECGFETLAVVNDFTALARSLPLLSATQKHQVGGGAAVAGSVIGLVGAGTGLGVSGLIPSDKGWTALLSEGGHVSFSPANETEVAVLRFAWREFDHVSAERMLSGAGIELIYRALAGHSQLCDDVIETFCCMLATVASNVAITLGAQGGVYIGGGIVPKLGARFDHSGFRARFEQKGRFSDYLAQVPTFVVTAEYPAFVGVSAILAEKLAKA